MCFQNNQREIKKRFPSVIEEKLDVVQLKVVVIELPFQTDFSFRNLMLKINDIILCIAFSILIFLYVNRVFIDTVFICAKKVDQESLTTFGKNLQKKGRNR